MSKGTGKVGAPIGNRNAAGSRNGSSKTKGWLSTAISNFNKERDKRALVDKYTKLDEKSKGVYGALVNKNVVKIPKNGLNSANLPGYPKTSNAEFQQYRQILKDYGNLTKE